MRCFTTFCSAYVPLLCCNSSLRGRLRRFRSRGRCWPRRNTCLFPSPEVYFTLADSLAGLLPPSGSLLATFLSQLGEGWPVYAVVVLEVDFAAGILHELRGGDVIGEGLVVANFGLCDGVDEGGDELEEGSDVPGH
jgi:hypothetical protein